MQGAEMGPQRISSNIPSLVVAAPGQSANTDRRLHRRHGPEEISLTFLGVEHPVLNWSEGGVLLVDRHPDLPIGSTIAGVLSIRGQGGRFRFAARLLRRDTRAKELALCFVDPSPALATALSRLSERG